MATLSYATPGTGVIAGGLGWINWGTFTIAPNTTVNNITAALKDGSILSFNLTNTHISGTAVSFIATQPPTWGGAPFGVDGYTGMVGRTVLFVSGGNTGSRTITMSNIQVTDPLGNPVTNYTIYACDGEASTSGENWVYTTNGSPWSLLTNIGSGASPVVTGLGTTVATLTGNASGSYKAPVLGSIAPTTVITQNNQVSGGLSGIVFGISITKVTLNKVITSRYNSSDQFKLDIIGDTSASTITYGSTYGGQNVFAYIFASIPSGGSPLSYVLTESMAPGSVSLLSNYSSTIRYTNLTPGGTTVPSSTTIPSNLTLGLADIIVATITNSIIPTTVVSSKSAIKYTSINSVVTYTLTYNNLGPTTAINVILKDTIPNGTTYQTNSFMVNGVPLLGNPSPPTGITIGTLPLGITTITFNVQVTTLPSPNPFLNSASLSYNYDILPTQGIGASNTNTVSTKVNSASLTNSKIVNKSFANIGDILTYTIPIKNIGNLTTLLVTFIDTIPNGTALVLGSLKQDGTTLVGNTNPPGITINNIGPGKVSTIVFKVTILTLPSPNPIPNYATTISQFIIDPSIPIPTVETFVSNTVTTQINNANLSSITKFVDKAFASCGDLINYIIAIPNTGSVTALNIILKDTIPNGTMFVDNSLFIDGQQILGANLTSGITLPNIPPGVTSTITFQVTVNCL